MRSRSKLSSFDHGIDFPFGLQPIVKGQGAMETAPLSDAIGRDLDQMVPLLGPDRRSCNALGRYAPPVSRGNFLLHNPGGTNIIFGGDGRAGRCLLDGRNSWSNRRNLGI
jgi:hypothetical protein